MPATPAMSFPTPLNFAAPSAAPRLKTGRCCTGRVEEISHGIAEAMGGTVEIDILFGVPAVMNEPEMAAIVREAVTDCSEPIA